MFCFLFRFCVCSKVVVAFIENRCTSRTVNSKQVSVPFANCLMFILYVQTHSIELCTFRILLRSYLFISCALLLLLFVEFLLLAFLIFPYAIVCDCRFSLSRTFEQMNAKTGGIWKKTRVSSVLPTAYRSFSLSHELSHSIGIALIPSKLNFLNNFFDYRSLLVLRCYIRFLLFDFLAKLWLLKNVKYTIVSSPQKIQFMCVLVFVSRYETWYH